MIMFNQDEGGASEAMEYSRPTPDPRRKGSAAATRVVSDAELLVLAKDIVRLRRDIAEALIEKAERSGYRLEP